VPPIVDYATKTDLQRYGLGEQIVADPAYDALIDAALDAAARVADKKLANQYTLPLTAISTDLTMYVSWIAAYVVMSSIGYSPEAGQDNIYRQRYLDALKWLDEVADGEAPVGIEGSPDLPQGSVGSLIRASVISGSSRGFSTRGDPPGAVFDLNGGRGGFVGD
jgi:phage gp36-like protein